jgi:seryl-tRNA synthetase
LLRDADAQWRKARFSMDSLNKAKKQVSKQIGNKMKEMRKTGQSGSGDAAESSTEAKDPDILELTTLFDKISTANAESTLEELMSYRKQVDLQVVQVEGQLEEIENGRNEILRDIGNLIHADVPISNNEDENAVVRTWGDVTLGTEAGSPTFKSHVDLIVDIDGMDGEHGADVSGSRGYFLKGAGWFLKEALLNYAVRFLSDRDYDVLEPPYWMRKSLMSQVAQLEQFDEELYKVVGSKSNPDAEEKYLIATAEQPIAALHREEWLNPERLPIRYCGVSTCFRQEVGAHGRDTRGIFRVHQFDKVEQFLLCSPADSWTHFHQMMKNSEEFYQSLGIPYRVINIVSGALNYAAAMKLDLEAWFPASKQFRELVSVSNCTDYQARRLGVRFGQTKKMNGQVEYVHMLNGTMCATSRTVCALLELNQTPEGIRVPEVLAPFMPAKYQQLIPYKKQ